MQMNMSQANALHEPFFNLKNGSRESGVHVFEPNAPVLSHEKLLRVQGYSNMLKVRPAILHTAQEMARRAEKLTQPCIAYKFLRIQSLDSDGIQLESGARLSSPAFQSKLAGCVELLPFVMSCGTPLSKTIIDLAEGGDLLEAVLLETAGWLCIEDATRQLKELFRSQVDARGYRMSSRMGPGYTYQIGAKQVHWPLEDHPAFFQLFGDSVLPATLMSSCGMSPKLSRSGLYGIAPLEPNSLQAGMSEFFN